VRANPELARRIAGAGHLIGNHSNYHAPMDTLTDEGLRRDIAKAESTIGATTGVDPKPWFRCPFGAGMDDPRVLAAIEELGYRHVGWDHDPRDWDEGRTVDELVAGVGPGIVLLHAWPAVTADGLERVIADLRGRGAEFVGLDELA
jgi:peptidoglycan/xylan/chitin deacetylase (PgdA/CDA1 family)